ncbi:RNA polymerase sigma factor [Myroides fluvii]|uniref:RNA polymerase sigma factor n=1 Tax=Myroides fluvii TaxID=2572594 RepID=UPI00131DF23F|nr:sigma-70 family RNA polymerase sigma factor [Myroides fluvii]
MSREKRVIKQIQAGEQKAIEEVYMLYKKEFTLFAGRFAISEQDTADIYQDSIIAMYENILAGDLKVFSSSIKTYLFAIGKYKIYNRLNVKIVTEDFVDYEFLLKQEKEEEWAIEEEQLAQVLSSYQLLGHRCQEVLTLFYYENLSMEQIKQKLNYASSDVVKSQKSRCIKQLKALVFKTK